MMPYYLANTLSSKNWCVFTDLETLDIGMSNERQDLAKSGETTLLRLYSTSLPLLYLQVIVVSLQIQWLIDRLVAVITPAPPLHCRVGLPCEFVLSTRTSESLLLPHGGLQVSVQEAFASVRETSTQSTDCRDLMDGRYACTFPAAWTAVERTLVFSVFADGNPIEPLRTIVDPTSGAESTLPTYGSELVVINAGIQCSALNSLPNAEGSVCICSEGYYRRDFGDGQWSCERCQRGYEPDVTHTRCDVCAFGKFSSSGERCETCEAGYEPNKATSADSCETCDETSSSDGRECKRCPVDQEADASHTSCVCPINMYNTTKRRGNVVRCMQQGLRGDDQAAGAVCVPCGDLECVECSAGGILEIRPEYSIAQPDQPWLVFKCPFEGACQNNRDQRCKTGHTGLLCAVCEPGYGLDRDDCVECSSTNSNPFAAMLLLGAVCVIAAAVYMWRRRSRGVGDMAELSQGLIANPLQNSPVNPRGSSSSSSGGGKAAAQAVAQKSSDLYTMLRVIYQPVRIIVGYIQVVTQIGPVLDLEFPQYIRTVLEALKPFMIDLQSILQLDCLSDGLLDFYAMWLVRVFVIPAAMIGVVGLQYCYERRRVGHPTAIGYAKANVFVVVFLCYPGVCNQAFGMFNCRKVGVELSVLVKDYSIHCSTEKHQVFQVIAGLYIATVAFGIPLRMARLMFKRMQEYGGGNASDRFVARRVADELKLDDAAASDAIRDCSTGREYSFLVNAFKPRFYFWEGEHRPAHVARAQSRLETARAASHWSSLASIPDDKRLLCLLPFPPPSIFRVPSCDRLISGCHCRRLRHDPQADAGRDAGGGRPRQRCAAVSRHRDLFSEFRLAGQAGAVQTFRGQRAQGSRRGAHLLAGLDRVGAEGAALRGRRRSDT
eukprot:SAG22_NODE_89_length_21278_cov_16.698758_6_plen_888_part_00